MNLVRNPAPDPASWPAAPWTPAEAIDRPFVRHRSPARSPGLIARLGGPPEAARLSVAIPSLDGVRNGYLPRLLNQIARQDGVPYEVLIVRGDPRQGRAINVAAALAAGEFLLTLDDDTSLPEPDTFAKLTAVMERHPDIGLAGGNNLIPEDATFFIKRTMKEIPRRSWPMVSAITDSDLAEHPCLIMRTAEFKSVGGENELIPRGLDPYLRREFRQAGKRVVVVPGVVYHHLPPGTPSRLLKQFYRNGREAAFVNWHFPQWVIETPESHGEFRDHIPPVYRMGRFGWRLLQALLRGRLILFSSEMGYALGYLSYRFQRNPSA